MILAALLACHRDEPVVLPDPDALAPLDAVNLAPELSPGEDGLHPEEITFASGEREDKLYWAHAKAYVHETPDVVWGCLRQTDVVVDRREVDEWSSEADPEPEFDDSLLIHNTVHDIITVDYDLLWLHEVQEGTLDAPTAVAIQWQKVEGSNVIELLIGTALLSDEEDGTTRLELEEHFKAALRDEETIVSYLDDLYASVVACAHDEPLPAW